MARLRSIKPDFFRNEDLAEVSLSARLLFIGLWTLADRRGVLEDRPKRIKADLFPYDHVDVDTDLNALADRGFIERYIGNGTPCIFICKFDKHQYPHQKEPASDLPLPGQSDTSTGQAPDLTDTSPPLTVKQGSVNQGLVKQGSVDRALSSDDDESESTGPKYPPAFDSFWSAYPTGNGAKKTAYAQWQRLKPAERARLPDALAAWNACERWQAGYVKNCDLWIRDRLWDQPPPPPKPANITPLNRAGPPGKPDRDQMRQWAAELNQELGQP